MIGLDMEQRLMTDDRERALSLSLVSSRRVSGPHKVESLPFPLAYRPRPSSNQPLCSALAVLVLCAVSLSSHASRTRPASATERRTQSSVTISAEQERASHLANEHTPARLPRTLGVTRMRDQAARGGNRSCSLPILRPISCSCDPNHSLDPDHSNENPPRLARTSLSWLINSTDSSRLANCHLQTNDSALTCCVARGSCARTPQTGDDVPRSSFLS